MTKHPEFVFRVSTNLPFSLQCSVSIFAVKVMHLCKHECLRTQKVFFFHVNSIIFDNLENSLLHNECAACCGCAIKLNSQSLPLMYFNSGGEGESN